MLSTFLNQLQTYFSKYFVLASFCPMLVFAVLNAIAAYLVFEGWQHWVDANLLKQGIIQQAVLSTSLTVAIVLGAFVLSSLSTFARQVLEGRWPAPLRALMVPAQNHRRGRLIQEFWDTLANLTDLRSSEEWKRRMRDARQKGQVRKHAVPFRPAARDGVEIELSTLKSRRTRYELLDSDTLENLVRQIEERLEKHNVDESPALETEQRTLIGLIDYAQERARGQYAYLQNRRNASYGEQSVAPTTMGNIANTIQSYAMRRYRCNLDVLWSNLQRVIQKDDKAQAWLLESKTQLDFLIACAWLTLLSVCLWALIFVFIAPARTWFVSVALAGPLVSYLWYRAASEQYRSFADIAMTLFDTYRFDLLQQLGFNLPADVNDERTLWEAVDRVSTYGADDCNLRYRPPAPK